MSSPSPENGTAPISQRATRDELPTMIGRYRILRLIGEGAMGRVLLAHDPVLDREVALKHLRDDLRIPRDVRDGLIVRMRHEARAAARVPHPNLVTLHDMGEDPSLGLYLVFEYVEGPTLKDRLLEGPLLPSQAARLARELGDALSQAHRAGIVHRDIKPENIILSTTGGKIADFGIARIPDSTLTHQGGLMGTPAYSAPETFRAGKFSPESDQFSLAAVMYEALSGLRAFPGEDAVSVAARIAQDTPPPVSRPLGLSAAIDEVLSRGLAKKPEDRYPSCEAFGAAFALCLETRVAESMATTAPGLTSAAVPRPATTESTFPPQDRKLGQVIVGAIVVLATAALLLRTALRASEHEESEEPAAAPPVTAAPSASASASVRSRIAPPARPARPKTEPGEPAAPSASASAPAGPDAGATSADAGAHGADAGP